MLPSNYAWKEVKQMTKKEKAALTMVVALVGSAYLGKVAKQQGAALGLSVAAVSLISYAIAAAL
ncbi:hypothetical protein ACIRJO_02845 [Streptomyces sp. NPDC102394]|uniref:hypothetical protein n=1 Tax=Streptomyces sp. NPDC102394 TaxID=3366167 RepID=UPI00381A4F5F